MATLISVGGNEKYVSPKNGVSFELEEMYSLIGCETVELVRLNDGRLMWLDEDGKSKGLSRNSKATFLLGDNYDYVVGSVLITTVKEGGS